jgi:hypothetical protein
MNFAPLNRFFTVAMLPPVEAGLITWFSSLAVLLAVFFGFRLSGSGCGGSLRSFRGDRFPLFRS